MFISPDSIIPDPSDFFSYNRYLYARGNPIGNHDPTGHAACGLVAFCYDPGFGLAGGLRQLARDATGMAMAGGIVIGSHATAMTNYAAANAPVGVEHLPGMVEHWLYSGHIGTPSLPNGFGQFEPGGFNFDPNQFDPKKYTAQDIGKEAHRRFRQEARTQMEALGRQEKPGDFLTEKAIRDANGNVVRDALGRYGRPDVVDYKNHIIYDLKPWQEGGLTTIRNTYSNQISRYESLYEQAYGIKPQIVIILYGGPPTP